MCNASRRAYSLNKLLLIDDQQAIRSLLNAIFAHDSRFTLLSASDGEEGLAKIQEEKPDLILLDVKLPGINGIEICKMLKADRATSHIKIFLLTAATQTSDLENAANSGADDIITKPFSVSNLKYKVERAFDLD